MIQQTLAITRNTFFESVRQPIMLVVLTAAAILIIMSNPLAAFTMEDDQKMLIDIGLATVFLFGAILASFIATSVLTREIENKTALTVVSKPVPRPLFILGKFLGVAMAMLIGCLLMCFVFMLVELHSVLQTVRDPIHLPVVTFGVLAGVLGVSIGVWCNYFYSMSFASTTVCATTPLLAGAYVLSLMFRSDFTPQNPAVSFKIEIWVALASLIMAILILTAIAIAASTRFGQVMTLIITIAVFLLGLLSDWFFGKQVAYYEQHWSQQAQLLPDLRVRQLSTDYDLDHVKSWWLAQRRAEAEAQSWQTQNLLQEDIRTSNRRLRDRPLEERLDAVEAITNAWQQKRMLDLEREHGVLAEQARLISHPLDKELLVIDARVPQVIQLINGEIDISLKRELHVYPELLAEVKSPSELLRYWAFRAAHSIVPNFQVLWLSDALTQRHVIPGSYLVRSLVYGMVHIVLLLALSVVLFQRREVG